MRVLRSSGRASCCGFFRISSASACRYLSMAARRSSISFFSSSSLAPRSSAWRKCVLRLAQRLLGLRRHCRPRAASPCPTCAPPPRATGRRSWRGRGRSRSSASRDRPPVSGVKRSGAMVSASSAVSTIGLAPASSASMRRCSIRARATGLTKMRCGSVNSTGSLRPSLPASSRATSVTVDLRRRPRDAR